MSKSKANSVGDACECSNLNTSNNGNCPIPGTSTPDVNLEVNVIPKKRSKSPEEVNFSNKGKGKYSKNSKRKKGEVSKNFSEESASNKKSDICKVQKKELLCQTSQNSSALFQYKSEENSKQKMESLVPNTNDNINTASSSMNDTNLEPQNNNSAQESSVKECSAEKSNVEWKTGRRKRAVKKKTNQTSEITKAEDESHHTAEKEERNKDDFEEELTCSICSEIFISAVTLNCSHSFCKYCIMQWRKNHSTCPICRQKISSQNSTLVLDKCVERVLETSKEEIKKHRKELKEYREKQKEPDIPLVTAPSINNDENLWEDLDDDSSGDEYLFSDEHDFHDDEYFDQSDYYEEDEYYDDEVEYEEEVDDDHDEVGSVQDASYEDEGQEEETNEEELEYEEDESEDSAGEGREDEFEYCI